MSKPQQQVFLLSVSWFLGCPFQSIPLADTLTYVVTMFMFGSRKRVSSSSYHFVTTTPRALNTTTVATRLCHDGPHLAAHRQKASATRPSCGVVAAEPIRTRLIDMHTLSKRIARRRNVTSEAVVFRRLHSGRTVEIWCRTTKQI